jgi:hypothetical protein
VLITRGSSVASAAAVRALLRHVPEARAVEGGVSGLPESSSTRDAPELIAPTVIEGSVMRAVRVDGDRTATVAAFLDGVQRTEVVGHVEGMPIVLGTVAAVVRVRRERRLIAWGHKPPVVQRRFYVPVEYLPGFRLDELARDAGVVAVVDTLATRKVAPHPTALLEAASQRIDEDRHHLETSLAEEWCRRESSPILIDGGIQASSQLASAECAVGVVKSHRRLFAEGASLRIVLGLDAGERTSVFRVSPRGRYSVMSWYLRVRSAKGHDAMWGLIRVEASECDRPTERADEISRWILAENAPLALPDGRWDKMTYGIYDCEEFLRAIS